MVATILSDAQKRERVLSTCDASEVLREAFFQTEACMNHQYEVFPGIRFCFCLSFLHLRYILAYMCIHIRYPMPFSCLVGYLEYQIIYMHK